jgi:hypothetical protein
MKPRLHYSILICCALGLLPLLMTRVYAQESTTLTEKDIRTMLDQSDRAAEKGNVTRMMEPVSKDVKIKLAITTPQSNGEQTGYLTREKLESNFRQNMRLRRSYKIVRKNIKIKIYDDNTAMVESELYETFTTRQGSLRSSASEVLFVSLKDGKVVIDNIDVRMRIY